MCTTTTWIETRKLKQFQELVKCHNFRFTEKPLIFDTRTRVVVSSDHLPPGVDGAFWREWERMTTEITETVRRRSLIKRVLEQARRMVRKGPEGNRT